MQPPDAHERLLALALGSMPVDHPVCILCEGEPTLLGIRKIDGIMMAYCLCQGCCQNPTFFAEVEAHIRGWMLARRRN